MALVVIEEHVYVCIPETCVRFGYCKRAYTSAVAMVQTGISRAFDSHSSLSDSLPRLSECS